MLVGAEAIDADYEENVPLSAFGVANQVILWMSDLANSPILKQQIFEVTLQALVQRYMVNIFWVRMDGCNWKHSDSWTTALFVITLVSPGGFQRRCPN